MQIWREGLLGAGRSAHPGTEINLQSSVLPSLYSVFSGSEMSIGRYKPEGIQKAAPINIHMSGVAAPGCGGENKAVFHKQAEPNYVWQASFPMANDLKISF